LGSCPAASGSFTAILHARRHRNTRKLAARPSSAPLQHISTTGRVCSVVTRRSTSAANDETHHTASSNVQPLCCAQHRGISGQTSAPASRLPLGSAATSASAPNVHRVSRNTRSPSYQSAPRGGQTPSATPPQRRQRRPRQHDTDMHNDCVRERLRSSALRFHYFTRD